MNELQLVIAMNAQSQVQVTGPINNNILCYGLLEEARNAIEDHGDKQARGGGLLVAQGVIPNGFAGR